MYFRYAPAGIGPVWPCKESFQLTDLPESELLPKPNTPGKQYIQGKHFLSWFPPQSLLL